MKVRLRRFVLLASIVMTGLIAVAAFLAVHGPPGAAAPPQPTFAYGLMRAVNVGAGEVYPDQKVAITLNKGYGYQDNNKIITSGLSQVAVGSYAYFEGKAKDDAGKTIASWKWTLVERPTYSQAALEKADTQFPRLLTDKAGTYQVKITAKNVDGAEGSSTLTVTAATYVGVERCSMCHSGNVMPDQVTPWRETGHATKFEVTWPSYSATSDYCIKCHVTGYNEADQGNGFDNLARLSGWDPSKGSLLGWLKASWTLDQTLQAPMGKLANIQCESCHGPTSIHAEAKSYDPGVCGQCHGQINQWRYSGHAKGTGYLSADRQNYNAGCVKCHTGEGFVEQIIRGKTPVWPYLATASQPATLSTDPSEMAPIACATCHDPHAATDPDVTNQKSKQLRLEGDVKLPIGVTVKAGESAVCVTCHDGRRDATYMKNYLAGTGTRGPHGNTQAPVFYGVTQFAFPFGATLTNSAHTTVVTEGCAQCHMAPNYLVSPGPDGKEGTRDDVTALSVGGHSWNVEGEWEGKMLQNVKNACGSCHTDLTSFDRTARSDYDGDGQVEGIQDEVEGLLALLADKLPKNAATGAVLSSPINASTTTEVQRGALWNYWLIVNDGSEGVHNTGFTVGLLQTTYKALTGQNVPGATIR